MSDRVTQLKPTLDALTNEERIEVLNYLADRAEVDEELTEAEWEEEWGAEATRRLEDLRSGKTTDVSAEEFMQRMKEKYG